MNRFILCLLCVYSFSLYAESYDLSATEKKINDLLKEEIKNTMSVTTCQPDRHITSLMSKIDEIGQQLMSQEQTDSVLSLSEKCLAILAALRERRIYAYMLWAECLLERASSGRYGNLAALDQNTLMALYCKLSEINISVIKENMLNREIMTRLSEIYDCLTPENKKSVRVNAIHQQRDPLSQIEHIPLRKTVDDF